MLEVIMCTPFSSVSTLKTRFRNPPNGFAWCFVIIFYRSKTVRIYQWLQGRYMWQWMTYMIIVQVFYYRRVIKHPLTLIVVSGKTNQHFYSLRTQNKTRAVTKCESIPPPALWQKLVSCTQMDKQTERQTSWFQYTPEKHSFCGGIIKFKRQV